MRPTHLFGELMLMQLLDMLNNDGENPQLMHTKQIQVYVTI